MKLRERFQKKYRTVESSTGKILLSSEDSMEAADMISEWHLQRNLDFLFMIRRL